MKDNINDLQKVARVLKLAGSVLGNPEAIFKAIDESTSLFAWVGYSPG